MEIQGEIKEILEVQTGSGANGEWKKGGFVLETKDKFPKAVAIDLWGKSLEGFTFTVGDNVNAFVNIESREYNGKWFTNVGAWKIEGVGDSSNEEYTGITPEVPEDDPLPF